MDITIVVMPIPGTSPATMPNKIPHTAATKMLMELFSKLIDLLEPLVFSENESLYESNIDCECPLSLLCKSIVEVITKYGSLDDSLLFILKKVYKELDNPFDRLKKRLISEQLFILDQLLMYFDHENSICF